MTRSLLLRFYVVATIASNLLLVAFAEEGNIRAAANKNERVLSLSCLPEDADDPSSVGNRVLNIMDTNQVTTWKKTCRKTKRCLRLKNDISNGGRGGSFRRYRYWRCVTRCKKKRKQIKAAEKAAALTGCTPCFDGSEPAYDAGKDSVVYVSGSGKNITCQILLDDVFAGLTSDDVTSGYCAAWQEVFAYYCGCQPPPPEEKVCPLCPNGETVPDLDLSPAHVPFASGTCSCTNNCRSALVAAGRAGASENCQTYQQIGLLYCGCSIPEEKEDACPLCGTANGVEVDVPAPEQDAVSDNFSCDMMANVSRIQDTTNGDCERFQSIMGGYCNCPNVSDPSMDDDTFCRVCGNQTLPDPLRVVDVAFVGNMTCGAFEYSLNHEPGIFLLGCGMRAFGSNCCL